MVSIIYHLLIIESIQQKCWNRYIRQVNRTSLTQNYEKDFQKKKKKKKTNQGQKIIENDGKNKSWISYREKQIMLKLTLPQALMSRLFLRRSTISLFKYFCTAFLFFFIPSSRTFKSFKFDLLYQKKEKKKSEMKIKIA